MTHIVAGYPTLAESEQIAKTMIDNHVAFLEIQIPFSDPLADGPTIMNACQVALENGTTPQQSLDLVVRLSEYAKEVNSPTKLLIMTYYNIIYKFGIAEFTKQAGELNCYGLIVPDMPLDATAHEDFYPKCKDHDLHAIQIVSPITPSERIQKIAEHASGFIYCVARTGTTGATNSVNTELGDYLQRIRQHTSLPLAVGFGISSADQVKEVLAHADYAVIGSHLINTYNSQGITGTEEFLKSL